ncbi:MAG: methionine adenosyltransferase, partial [Clostridia bacterium]|nr:methionine adenosyltransferase [Clostridia bacterium]
MLFKKISTSESVTEGHPDKLCDAVSDGVLDAILAKDRMARVACESVATTGMVFVTGEISTNANVDIQSVVRNTVKNIGYTDSAMGFDYKTCAVVTSIKGQSADIAMGVDSSLEYKSGNKTDYDLIGAGDQGTVFGYACSDTPEYMPMTLSLAHKLTKRLAKVRKDGTLPFLWPDGKAQVTIAYDDEMKPIFCPAVVLSTQHTPDVSIDTLREAVREEIIDKIIPSELITAETKYYINPTGRFVTGGPDGDSGLTGRKLICDTYGGLGHHGGGAF